MKKPNVYWHMVRWGFGSGTIFVVLYIAALSNNTSFIFEPVIWMGAAIYGGISGIVLGFINALAIAILYELAHSKRSPAPTIYATVLLINLIVSLIMPVIVFSLNLPFLLYLHLYIIPPLGVIVPAMYATHRYLLHLRLYYEQEEKEKREGKPKQDVNRLVDDLNELEFYEAQEDSRQRHEG